MNEQIKISDQPPLSEWVGRTSHETGCVSVLDARRIHAALSNDGRAPEAGEVLPGLWHWCAFPPSAPMADLGQDGHPKLGGFLPPVPLERRMWAAGEVAFHAPILVGEYLRKTSTITAISEKTGSAGDMVFVTVTHAISGLSGPCVTERQDIVYLNIPNSFSPPPKKAVPDEGVSLRVDVPLSEALLFRYSAVTYNAHRIHYDLNYAKDVEHYPGLVVHGPLQASLLIAEAERHRGTPPTRFVFRGVHPMFHDQPMQIIGTEKENGDMALCTAVPGSHQGMQATAYWETT